ncbi:MAG: hypothetical protein HYU69_05385 [Bacteroidetes bacterium]|nr:hypothetical protein [Bacteroidota bacterium]
MANNFNINNIIKPSQVAGLDIYIHPDGHYTFNTVVLKQNKNAIALIKQEPNIKSIEELKNIVNAKTPLSIVINGKGILQKKIEVTENDTPAALLSKVLPNAKAEEFLLSRYTIDENQAIVSVIRKNVLDPIIEQLQKAGLDVINLSLGPFVAAQLLPVINNKNNSIALEYFNLQTEENRVIGYEATERSTETKVKVGSDTISNHLLIAFAASFREFLGASESDIPEVNVLRNTYKSKRIFKLAGTSLFIFFISVLSINSFILDHYSKQAKNLNSQVNISRGMLQNLEKLKTELSEKSAFMNKMGLLQPGRSSFFADRIAGIIPASIQLKEMNINPLVKNPNDDKDIAFNVNSIEMKGDCKKNTELNEWIKQLKRFDWVSDVTLTNFTQDKEKNAGIFNMELKIK